MSHPLKVGRTENTKEQNAFFRHLFFIQNQTLIQSFNRLKTFTSSRVPRR